MANALIAATMATFPFVQNPKPFLIVVIGIVLTLCLTRRWVAEGSLGR